MAVINLHEKYESKILRGFDHESYIGSRTSKEYSWGEHRTIHITTPNTMELNKYKRNGFNRFGNPDEIGDSVQSLTVAEDIAYTGTIDRGNATEQQQTKKGAEIIANQTKNVVSPYMDKHAFKVWANNAGIVKAVANPTKSTIIGQIFDAVTDMDNALVPLENRTIYVPATTYNMIRTSDQYMQVDPLAKKALEKGVVGELADCMVVKVPDKLLPDKVRFLIVHSSSVLFPKKVNTTRILTEAPGLDGHLLEARHIFDAFVLGERANGVFAGADTSIVLETPAVSNTGANYTLTSAGNTIYYTLDKSDPRYSKTALVYSAPVTLQSGQTIKFCAKNPAKLTSMVGEKTHA